MGLSKRNWTIVALTIVIMVLLAACGDSDSGGSGLPELQPSVTARPAVTPTDVPEHDPLALAPPAPWEDVERFKQAMRPAHANDVYEFATRDRYYVEASLVFENGVALLRGAERVRYTNNSADTLDTVVFRLYTNLAMLGGRMLIYDSLVDGAPVEPAYSQRDSVLTVPLSAPLGPGDAVEIDLQFSIAAEQGMFASYGPFGYQNDLFSAPEWYPMLSVYDEGRGWWVERPKDNGDAGYGASGLHETLLTVPENFVVAMSGSQIGVEFNGDGTKTLHYVSGPMRDSLVVAGPSLGVLTSYVNEATGYVGAERADDNDVQVNVLYWPGDESVAADVLDMASDAMRIYGEKFGAYPFAEFDLAETFNLTGIEYPGIIVVAERFWTRGNDFLEVIVAHEVGHQWFYSVVGNNQVTFPWMDEALTSYTEYVYMRNRYDERRAKLYQDANMNAYTGHLRRGNPDRVLGLPVGSYVDNDYGVIVYTKGKLFYAELEDLLGRETFLKALQLYYARHKYGIVESRDILEALEDSSGVDLDASFLQKVGEFPGLDTPQFCRGDLLPQERPVVNNMSRRALRWLYGTACGSGRTLPQGQQSGF